MGIPILLIGTLVGCGSNAIVCNIRDYLSSILLLLHPWPKRKENGSFWGKKEEWSDTLFLFLLRMNSQDIGGATFGMKVQICWISLQLVRCSCFSHILVPVVRMIARNRVVHQNIAAVTGNIITNVVPGPTLLVFIPPLLSIISTRIIKSFWMSVMVISLDLHDSINLVGDLVVI